MTFIMKQSGTGDVVPVPSGQYTAVLESVEEKEATGGQFSGVFRVWNFLADVNGSLLPVSGTSSVSNGNRTKTYQWLTAIMGSEPTLGVAVDPIGKKCLITVVQKDGFPRVDKVEHFSAPTELMPGVPR